MTSYDFGLSGSWPLLILCCLIGLALSIYTYRITVPPITQLRRITLISLRSVGLALLLFILFEPILNIIKASEEPPRLAVLLDNSQSVAITDASVDRQAQYRQALASMNPDSFGDDARILRFDSHPDNLDAFNADSLDFSGQLSNISSAFTAVLAEAEHENVRAVLLVTDGSYNAGENPVYNAELLGRPVYVVGIGDSTEPKDLAIQSLITNQIAYVGSPVPVNVNVKSIGYEEGDVTVQLRDDGKVIDEQTISLRPGVNTYTLVFEYRPEQEGTRKLQVDLSALDGELTNKNNRAVEFVKVLKTKRSIVIVAGAPTPDLAFIRNVLGQDRDVEVRVFVQKKGAEFLGDAPTAEALAQAEAIILIGFPISSTDPASVQMIADAVRRGKPLMFIAARNLDYSRLRPLEPYLPFTTSASQSQEMLAFADVGTRAVTHPVMKVNGRADDAELWNKLPPIFRTETFVRSKPEARVLATIKINSAPLNEPLILLRSLQNRKTLAVLGYGLFRWKLQGYAVEQARGREDARDIFSSFIENSIRWLTTEDQGKLVRIKTSQRLYANGERVEVIGQVYDATYNPIDNADVRVTITGGPEPRDLILSSLGGGRYHATVEGLPESDYAFNGKVLVNESLYGRDNGRFSVGELNIEYQNPYMNAPLLRTLAERTGGRFYTANTVKNIAADIRASSSFAARPITEKSEILLWSVPWLLALAIIAFGLEWFTRKRGGMV